MESELVIKKDKRRRRQSPLANANFTLNNYYPLPAFNRNESRRDWQRQAIRSDSFFFSTRFNVSETLRYRRLRAETAWLADRWMQLKHAK